jgi:inorganic pyrophosphatase
MSEKVSRKKALANPVELNPFNADKGLLRVVIETPNGSRNKFAFSDDERISN